MVELLYLVLLFLFFAFIAEIAGTIAGFGSSTILIPLSLFLFDFKTALVLVAFAHVFGNLGRITFFKNGLDKKLIILFGIPSVLFTFLGAYFVVYIPQNISILILGIFLLIFSILSVKKNNLKIKATNNTAILGGGLSGFFAGLIGTGGVLRGAFLTAFSLKKTKYIAVSGAIALAVDLTRIPIYIVNGFLGYPYYYILPILLLVAFGGSYVGKLIFKRIPQDKFRVIVLIAISLVTIYLIIQSIF